MGKCHVSGCTQHITLKVCSLQCFLGSPFCTYWPFVPRMGVGVGGSKRSNHHLSESQMSCLIRRKWKGTFWLARPPESMNLSKFFAIIHSITP